MKEKIDINPIQLAEEYSELFNSQLSTKIVFTHVDDTEDPKGYLNSKPIVNQILIRYAYVTDKGVLWLDGEVKLEVKRFLDIGEAILSLKLYSDVIEDWEEDADSIFTNLEKLQMENTFFTKNEKFSDEIFKVFPLAAYLYDDNGYIYKCELTEAPFSFEGQNMYIEDAEEEAKSEYSYLEQAHEYYGC